MRFAALAMATAFLSLAGCTAPFPSGSRADGGLIRQLPEGVIAIAAPYQNLDAVRVLPEDGCYWYLHAGPVESTLLPLRSREGNPICTPTSTAG